MSDTGAYKIGSLLQAQKYYAQIPPAEQSVPSDEIIIKFRPSAKFDPDKLETRSARLNGTLKKHGVHKATRLHKGDPKKHNAKADKIGIDRLFVVKVPRGTNIRKMIDELRTNPEVEYAEQNYTVKVKATPNDPSFPSQWGLAKINAAAAWNINTGSNSVVVAVVDTGVDYTHTDLAANMWTNAGEIPGNGIDDDGNGCIDDDKGMNFAYGNNNPMDDHYHGTHVAGIIGAVGNNGVGISGVNWKVKIMPVKFLNSSGSGSYSNAVLALTYAADNGANVINNSWGGYYYSQALKDAVDYAQASGCVVVAAAGNSNTDVPMYPAALRNVISVAATDSSDNKASFSNYGPFIDVSAPGVGILSTLLGNTYGNLSGTSMASPFVAGLAALVKAKNPTFSNEDIRQVVLTSTDDLGTPGWDSSFGYGRINAFKAAQTTSVLVSNITSPDWNSVLNGIFSVSGTSAGTGFSRYEIAWGYGLAPSTWFTSGVSLSGGGMSAVNNGVLAAIDASFIANNGDFTVRIRSYDAANNVYEDRVPLFKNSLLKSGWPLLNEYSLYVSPILTDLNRDSKAEIIINTSNWGSSWGDIKLNVLNENGVNISGWPYISPYYHSFGPAAGDINGDGFPEVVASDSLDSMYAWDKNGSLLPGWPKDIGYYNSLGWPYYPTLSDIFKVGRDNIIYNMIDTIHVINDQGVEAAQWPRCFAGAANYFVNTAVGDVNADGEDEVVMATDLGEVHLLTKDNVELSGWPKTGLGLFGVGSGTPVIADVDNDGYMEIFMAFNDRVYGWDKDGNALPGWPKIISGANFTSSIAIGDITGDDKFEIIANDFNQDALYAWDYQGNDVPGWPVVGEGMRILTGGPVICDVDGCGTAEVLASSWATGWLYIYKGTGAPLSGFPFKPPIYDMSLSSPAVGDMDGDGKCEVVYSTQSWTYLFDLPGIYNPHKAPWPMIYRDAKNTSCIPYSFRTSNPLIAGQVNDTNGANTIDIDEQTGTQKISAAWGGFIDPNAGIPDFTYQLAIGTSQYGTDVVPWTSVGTNTSHTETGLSLVVGTKYYNSVRATDSKGNIIDAASDGVKIVVPSVIKTTPLKKVPDAFNAYNYPNPFYMSKGPTMIRCELPQDGILSVQIFDIQGRPVKQIASAENKPAGIYEYSWDGTDERGVKITEGAYFCVVKVKDKDGKEKYKKTIKMMVIL